MHAIDVVYSYTTHVNSPSLAHALWSARYYTQQRSSQAYPIQDRMVWAGSASSDLSKIQETCPNAMRDVRRGIGTHGVLFPISKAFFFISLFLLFFFFYPFSLLFFWLTGMEGGDDTKGCGKGWEGYLFGGVVFFWLAVWWMGWRSDPFSCLLSQFLLNISLPCLLHVSIRMCNPGRA
jgi:hypothetical protein